MVNVDDYVYVPCVDCWTDSGRTVVYNLHTVAAGFYRTQAWLRGYIALGLGAAEHGFDEEEEWRIFQGSNCESRASVL